MDQTLEHTGTPVPAYSILLIDDDVELCQLRGEYLRHHAFRLSFAYDGLSGLRFAILELLLRSRGRIVSRDVISAVLHHRHSTPYERSVDVHVSHLRKKLEPELVACIHTVRGVGDRLAVPQ